MHAKSLVEVVKAVPCAALVALCGCGSSDRASARMTVTSRAFAAGGAIPREFTCDGADVSPPLRFGGVPVGTRELDLTVTDPDAPGGGFVHWAVTGLPPALRSLPRGARPAHEARNGFGVTGYRGPCPPPGPPHRYVFRVEARAGARSAPLAVGELVGRYGRRP